MTFSVVAYDRETNSWGVGVASKFLAVGSAVPFAKFGIGAVATQAWSNYSYGPNGLSLLKTKSAKETVETLTSADDLRERRQLGIVDSKGNAYSFTGSECLDYAGSIVGDGFTVQGNILAGQSVIEAMAKEMEKNTPFIERILRALDAAESQGGDRRGKQSAAILVVGEEGYEEFTDKYVDIRIDDSPEPLKELNRVMTLWEATFFKEEMVPISDNLGEIQSALERLGYPDLESWAKDNNFEEKCTKDKIGKKTLEVLLKQ